MTAEVVISELGDISRFPNAKKICACAGLVPKVTTAQHDVDSFRTMSIGLSSIGVTNLDGLAQRQAQSLQ